MQRWPHAPLHRVNSNGAYIVTAGTYQKEHLFKSEKRLTFLQDSLIYLSLKYHWKLQAWAIFPNHYHFVATSEENSLKLPNFLTIFHSSTARRINEEDKCPGRKVWYQYWDTFISYHNSYLARLSYVHNNPVKHGIVENSLFYPWCSANWFFENADPEFRKIISLVKTDKVNVVDDF